jgi:hypothetical protein
MRNNPTDAERALTDTDSFWLSPTFPQDRLPLPAGHIPPFGYTVLRRAARHEAVQALAVVCDTHLLMLPDGVQIPIANDRISKNGQHCREGVRLPTRITLSQHNHNINDK